MKRNREILLVVMLLLASLFLTVSCGVPTESEAGPETENEAPDTASSETLSETEGSPSSESEPHTHAYLLTETVEGSCAEYGYHRYACSCGLSYKELIPAAHVYTTVKDVTGEYTKTVCTACGTYKIIRNQKYLYNINFENVKSPEEAANQPPNLEFYVIAGNGAERVTDGENAYMRIAASNYYVKDTSGVFVEGKKVVFSIDLKVEKFAHAELLSIVYLTDGKWAYNRGIIRIEADGTLGFYDKGNGKYTQPVRLSEKGYVTVTVAGDMKTGLFDVYVDGELVREGIRYFKPPSKSTAVYIRYFDQKKDFVACADNLKLYVADTPEFVVPSSGIVFSE